MYHLTMVAGGLVGGLLGWCLGWMVGQFSGAILARWVISRSMARSGPIGG